ncbi:hypothetical protein CFC21_018465 [Triticum aestivum]|uniref:Uncharacterized protein n=4 Tax=Triticum TaxID=4564 RepID=A0A9R1P2I4_TRITD|nr:hypothetical protein TRIUR3_18922 [Triticum urartu]KAF7003094.1 hypothetical protein CFC21_018465 [Triticum aestivum]VAH35394.1 unnamed protein product [Triticum turgidum subsp. durum]
MAKKVQVIATLLTLNLLFFTFANATGRPCPPGGGSGGGGSVCLNGLILVMLYFGTGIALFVSTSLLL